MKGVYTLKGVVKHYDWGGFSFIPGLLKQQNWEKKPFAEYWMGTHPLGISTVEFEKGATGGLDILAGNLPYLFKADYRPECQGQYSGRAGGRILPSPQDLALSR